MTKICSIVRNKQEIKNIENYVDAFIIPLKDFSINYENYFTIEEIKEIKTAKEIFVSVNKNIHNNELKDLEKNLLKLNELNVKGIIFYDIAVLNLTNRLKFKYELIWAQEHMTTNYQAINFWNDKGAKSAYLSSEITKEEIKTIIDNTKSKLFLNVFGYVPIFTSRRNLVNNYLETFDVKKSNGYKILKEGKEYPIVDTLLGTTVYTNYILNIIDEVKSLTIDYLVFNPFLFEEKTYKQILADYSNYGKIYFPKELGFLNKETIYKVKTND